MRELEEILGEITPRLATVMILNIDAYAEFYRSLTGYVMSPSEKQAVRHLLRLSLDRERQV